MKKFNKIFCTALAVTMAMSSMAISALAGDSRTMTVSLDKETAKAGDTVVATIVMDQTYDLSSISYTLSYDNDVFAVDTGLTSYYDDDAEEDIYHEKYIDQEWLIASKSTNAFAKKLNSILYTPTNAVAGTAGELKFAFFNASGSSITNSGAKNEREIGKFIFTVKNGAAAGNYDFEITLAETKYSAGDTPAVTKIKDTVTIEGSAPAGPVIGATTVNESPKTDNYADYTNEAGEACYTQGFNATVAVSGNTGAAYNAYDAVITAKRGDDTETKTVPGLTFVSGTTVQNGNVVVKLNVQYVPEGVTLTLNSITPVVK